MIIKKLFTLTILSLCCSTTLIAQEDGFWVRDPIRYNLSWYCKVIADGEVKIAQADTHSQQISGSLTIPSNIYYGGTNYKVTFLQINLAGFAVEQVTIPNTVVNIGGLYWCKSLKSIRIPSSVTTITGPGFLECPNLASVIIENGLKSIGKEAFKNCKSLASITLPNSLTNIGEEAFYNCESLTNVTIPNSVTRIEAGVFRSCRSLRNITIPNSVTSIGESAFLSCKNLTSITLPNSLTSIGKWAFSGSSLRSITIPSSVKSIGKLAFHYCDELKEIKGLHSNMIIAEDAFYGIPFSFDEYKKSFDYYATSYVYSKIKEWQKKRDFETTAQYKARVTKENQQKKIKELTKEAIKEYTTKNKLQVNLGDYDADYQMYALNSNYGQKYVKVPLAQAPSFKNNFQRAAINASYVPTEEGLKIDNLTITLNGKRYVAEKTAVEMALNIDIDLPEIVLSSNNSSGKAVSPTTSTNAKPTTTPVDQSIDKNIPMAPANNKNCFAVIIGNERYTHVAQVPYANNDERIFAEYCKKTLGLPEKNVKVYENASYGTMIGAVSDIQKIAKAFKGDISVIFYYAGHGIPDEATGDGYLLPIDADGLNMRVCYPLSQLYKELGEMNVRNVTCFMDACFSGAQRGNGMVVAARGVAIKAKTDHPTGNTVVFTAATDKQTAFPYEEKGHGMFTYYLLKKLRETKGDCTLGELGTYISDEVAKQAVVTNGKEQTPVVLTSAGVADNWKMMKLK